MGVVWQLQLWGKQWIYQETDGQLSRREGAGLLARVLEWGHKAESRGTGPAVQVDGFLLLEPQFLYLEIGARSRLLEELSAGKGRSWGYSSCPMPSILGLCPPPGTPSLVHFPLGAPAHSWPSHASGEGASG